MLNHLVFIHTYIHVTLLLLDPHDIHHEGKNINVELTFIILQFFFYFFLIKVEF